MINVIYVENQDILCEIVNIKTPKKTKNVIGVIAKVIQKNNVMLQPKSRHGVRVVIMILIHEVIVEASVLIKNGMLVGKDTKGIIIAIRLFTWMEGSCKKVASSLCIH